MRLAIAAAVLVSATVAHAQPARLQGFERTREAEAPYIDLLTFGVGERIFEKFGHAAICLRYHDPRHIPVCFNFGVTDFDEGMPLVWSFLRGEQEFWVEPSTYGAMYSFYRYEDRDIWLQTLPTTTAEARAIEDDLWAALGDDHRYQYDHFFNNCTTRLRDLLDKRLGGKLAIGATELYPLTFRQLGTSGLSELPPLVLLTDFIIGRQADDRPTRWEAMFHPGIFRAEIERTLGVEPQRLYTRKGHAFPDHGLAGRDSPLHGRLVMLAIALLFTLPLWLVRMPGRVARSILGASYAATFAYVLVETMPLLWEGLGSIALVVPVLGVAGIVVPLWRGERAAIAWAALHLGFWGLLVWGLAAMSSIEGVRWNELVFVVCPLDALLPVLRPQWRRRYVQLRLAVVILASLACAIGVFRQPLWIPILVAFLPLATLQLQASYVGVQPVRRRRGAGDADHVEEQAGQDQRVAGTDEQEPQDAGEPAAGVRLTGAGQ
ncbi:MAG: DUF4105 domain-containing protein [Kofleriaceae bacterium]